MRPAMTRYTSGTPYCWSTLRPAPRLQVYAGAASILTSWTAHDLGFNYEVELSIALYGSFNTTLHVLRTDNLTSTTCVPATT